MWMHPIAIACGNTFVLKPSERDPSASMLIAELWAEAGLPDGVFNVVNGDKVAVDALLDHPDVAAVSFVGSTPIARYVHRRATARANGCRRSAGPRTMPWCCRTPTSTLPPATSSRPPSVRPASAAWRSRPPWPWARRATRSSGVCARRRRRSRSAPATTRQATWGRWSPGRRRTASWATSAAASRPAPTWPSTAGPGGARARRRVLRRPHHLRPGHAGHGRLHRRDLRPGAVGAPRRRLDAAIDLVNANPYGNGTAIFTSSGRGGPPFHAGCRSA